MIQSDRLTKPEAGLGAGTSAKSTVALAWQTLVVGLRNTGSLNSSERPNAYETISYASSGDDGSNTGKFAYLAKCLVSCSVCEDHGPGSSATTTTIPPSTPTYERLIKGSAATFSPTCFIVTIDLIPEYAAPAATSKAVFSFVDHWTSIPGIFSRIKVSIISVDGVPG